MAQTLSAVRRQWLHLDVANAVESVYAETLDDHANDLAHHLWEAGALADPQKTIRYLSMAAKRVRLQGALTETGEFYREALMLLKRMPDTPERDQLELGLQLGIGAVLWLREVTPMPRPLPHINVRLIWAKDSAILRK